MTDAIFLSQKLFDQVIASDDTDVNSTALVNYFFGKYFVVLRREICLAAADHVENHVIQSENAEFLQAIYALHANSRPKAGFHAYTPKVLLGHLQNIAEDFHLDGKRKTSDINISSQVQLACVKSLHDMIDLIQSCPDERKKPLKMLIQERKNWNDAYMSLQESFQKAFLEIKSLMNVNAIMRYSNQLQSVREYLMKAKSLLPVWSKKIIELRKKLNKYPIVTLQDEILYNNLEVCVDKIKLLDFFMRAPMVSVKSRDGVFRLETQTYHEFQANFLFKAKLILKKLEIKKNLDHYNAVLQAKVDKAEQIYFAKLENKEFENAKNTYDTNEKEIVPRLSVSEMKEDEVLVQHNKNMANLRRLNDDFNKQFQEIESHIEIMTLSKKKTHPVSKDESTIDVQIHNTASTPRSRSCSMPVKIYGNTESEIQLPPFTEQKTPSEFLQLNTEDTFADEEVIMTPSAKHNPVMRHMRRLSVFATIPEPPALHHAGLSEEGEQNADAKKDELSSTLNLQVTQSM